MSHFNEVANEWDSEGKVKMMQKLASETKKHLNLNSKVDILDFGCGTGLFGLEFIDHANSLTGIDTSEGMLNVFDQKTASNDNIKSINIDLETKNINEQYGLIVSSMTFHHLQAPLQTLKKLKNNLGVDGQIAIVDLNEEDGTFHPDNEGMGVKHFGFSKKELSSWADELGLSMKHSFINTIEKNGKEFKQFLAVFK